jgi:hypothetical protein
MSEKKNYQKEEKEDLGKVKVAFLLQSFEVCGHLLQLRLKSKNLFVIRGGCTPRTMASNWRLTPRARASSAGGIHGGAS